MLPIYKLIPKFGTVATFALVTNTLWVSLCLNQGECVAYFNEISRFLPVMQTVILVAFEIYSDAISLGQNIRPNTQMRQSFSLLKLIINAYCFATQKLKSVLH